MYYNNMYIHLDYVNYMQYRYNYIHLHMIIDHLIHKYVIKNLFYRHTSLMSAGQLH